MKRPYKLNHPLYPHPLALERLKKYKDLQYEAHSGAFDVRYQQWFNACRVDIEEGLAEDRDLYHFVTAVYRLRNIDGEKIFYKEHIIGKDKDGINHSFDHFVGMYELLQIDRYFNYSTGKPANRYTGNTEKYYYIDYTPEKILELTELAPDNKHQNYYIIGNGGQKLTRDVFFNALTFAYLPFDDLYEVATSPLLSDAIRTKIRNIQSEHQERNQTIKVKSTSLGKQ